jgi:hypothetical protein
MDNRGAEALIFWVFVTLGTLVVLLLIYRSRVTAGPKLTLTGIVLALDALWYGLVTGLPNSQGVSLPMGNPALGDVALKLAAVLVLGGVVVTLLVHDTATVTYVAPELPRNVPPSV